MHCWNVAQKDSALRYSLNTRMTHEAAYNRYRHELEKIGIDSVSAFRRIIHSTQSLESAQRRKHLEEQRDGTKMRKCGIMQNMNKAKQIAPIAAAVISGGIMACAEAAQNAAVRASCIPPVIGKAA